VEVSVLLRSNVSENVPLQVKGDVAKPTIDAVP
jgi:hypothetical protein